MLTTLFANGEDFADALLVVGHEQHHLEMATLATMQLPETEVVICTSVAFEDLSIATAFRHTDAYTRTSDLKAEMLGYRACLPTSSTCMSPTSPGKSQGEALLYPPDDDYTESFSDDPEESPTKRQRISSPRRQGDEEEGRPVAACPTSPPPSSPPSSASPAATKTDDEESSPARAADNRAAKPPPKMTKAQQSAATKAAAKQKLTEKKQAADLQAQEIKEGHVARLQAGATGRAGKQPSVVRSKVGLRPPPKADNSGSAASSFGAFAGAVAATAASLEV